MEALKTFWVCWLLVFSVLVLVFCFLRKKSTVPWISAGVVALAWFFITWAGAWYTYYLVVFNKVS